MKEDLHAFAILAKCFYDNRDKYRNLEADAQKYAGLFNKKTKKNVSNSCRR